MKEKIYTIPVLDAFQTESECPFCTLYNTLEQNSINFTLGPSYMENDVRIETNKKGFCLPHYQMMSKEKNSLGLALMLHTHMIHVHKNLNELLKKQKPNKKSSFPSLFSKKGNTGVTENLVEQYLHEIHNSCYICEQIQNTFDRYVDTFFYLWKKDKSFIDLVKKCNGFCLQHFGVLYSAAPNFLNQIQLSDFYECIIPLQLENLKRIEEELDWFIKKFDYRYEKEPWKNSKDALPRGILKMAGSSKKV